MKREGLGLNRKMAVCVVVFGMLPALALSRNSTPPSHAPATSPAAATMQLAGSLSAANKTNYATRSQNAKFGVSIGNCTDAGSLLTGGLPSGYTILPFAVLPRATFTCTLRGPGGTSASFTLTGIS